MEEIPTVRVSLIDTENRRIKFVCPHCLRPHYLNINSDWSAASNIWTGKCLFTIKQYYVRVWDRTTKELYGPCGKISNVPKPDCKECQGTGEFIGFNLISSCKSCGM